MSCMFSELFYFVKFYFLNLYNGCNNVYFMEFGEEGFIEKRVMKMFC